MAYLKYYISYIQNIEKKILKYIYSEMSSFIQLKK